MNAPAYLLFGLLFAVCSVGVLAFMLIGWLGLTQGLLWSVAALPAIGFLVLELYRSAR